MNPARREAIRNAIEAAKRNHARRSHLQRQLTLETVEQLKSECPDLSELTWPTALGVALHELAHLASACAIIGIVLVAAALFSGVK